MEYYVLVLGLHLMCLQLLHGIRIPFSKHFHTEQTSVEWLGTNRLRRDIAHTDTHFPDRTLARFKIGGNFQEIYLEKNHFIDIANIPVFMSRNGKIEKSYIPIDKEHVLYQSPDVGGSFLVTSRRSNISRNTEVFGTFFHNTSLYVIQPDVDPEVKGEGHVVSRVPDQKLIFESHPPKASTSRQETDSSIHNNEHPVHERSRREVKTYNVEIFSVVDYKSYQFWYDLTSGSNRHSQAVQQVMQYMAYVFNSVDMRYKTITGENFVYNILSAGIYIADTASASPWSENNEANGKVLSDVTLTSFTEWINEQNNLPQWDHAMGFTGYDVVSSTTGDSAGVAYLEKLCTSDSTSLVEENSFNFVSMTTAAHELGHSLGAQHDGFDNTCKDDDNYIMSSVNRVVTNDPERGQHLWQFSTCTVNDFKAFINKLDKENRNCMLQTSGSSKVPTTLRPMAQTYGPDETCVLRFGEGAYVCRSIQDYETICTSMFCNMPGTSQCYTTLPAEGTPCGNRKWCHQGRCVTSSLAPTNIADNCVLGDRPGLFDNTNKTCGQLIEEDPGKCYLDYTGTNCCGSCNAKRTTDANCLYGDHGRSFCSTMSRFGCYQNEEYCCATCKQQKNSSLPGCEYGDKFTGCLQASCKRYNAKNLAGCCETCFDPTKTVKPPTTTTTTSKTTISTTTTSTTTTTTTPTTTTTTTTTPKPTTTTTTTVSTKKTTSKPGTTEIASKTTKHTGDTTTQEGTFTSSPTSPEEKVSEMVLVVVGCAIGVIVVIVLVVIVCVCLRRRNAKLQEASGGRKLSEDNAYDNIGFVSAAAEKPRHPPPRRGSNRSSNQNVSNGSVKPEVSVVSNGTIDQADGYMMPATVHITTADGVQYSAPNKPKFKPLVPPNKPKKKAFSTPKPSPDLNKQRLSKPVHYKRTSGMSNSSTDTLTKTGTLPSTTDIKDNDFVIPDGYDSIGDIQKTPINRRPTLPENHPKSLPDLNNSKSKPNTDKNKIGSDGNSFPKIKKLGPECIDENSFDKRKVLPTLPPRPIPRIKSKQKRAATDANSNFISKTDRSDSQTVKDDESNLDNNSEKTHDVQKMADGIQARKPPTKPVPRRQISSTSLENETPALPMKKALRPPLKPVPRRRTSSDNEKMLQLSPAFDNEQLEIQI